MVLQPRKKKGPVIGEKLVPEMLGTKVANGIRQAILDGTLAPGERIRQEEIAKKYGVSRIPVREALYQLEQDGLVVLRANSGAWVAKLDVDEFEEIYLIRERLEPLALKESVENLSEEDIEQIDGLRLKMEHSANIEEFLRLDRDFHLLTYSATRLRTLLPMIDRFWNTTQHYRRYFTQQAGAERTWTIHADHRLLVDALKRRDPEEAERVLYGHIRRTRIDLVKTSVDLR